MENSRKWFNYLGLTILTVVSFTIGFYYGFRYHEANTGSVNLSQVQGIAESLTHTEIITKEIEGAFWIKSGQDPNCPTTHPVKGKFDSGACFYYTKDNPSYQKVKAHICFATEEFAQNQAGCLKKF